MHKLKLNKFLAISLLSYSLSCLAMFTEKNQTQIEAQKSLTKSIIFEKLSDIKRAIKEGADINFVDILDDTPLILAVRKDNYDVVKFLIDLGADVNKTTNEEKNTALHEASNISPEIIRLLIDSGADVNSQKERGVTPLLDYLHGKLMGKKIDLDIVQLFLNSGADLSLKNRKTNETALDLTKRLNMPKELKLLQEWQEKQRQFIKKEAGEYLISDLCDIAGEYVVGPIKKSDKRKLENQTY